MYYFTYLPFSELFASLGCVNLVRLNLNGRTQAAWPVALVAWLECWHEFLLFDNNFMFSLLTSHYPLDLLT